MKRSKLFIPIFIGMLMFGMLVNTSKLPIMKTLGVLEAWASATATATATATASPIPGKINSNESVSRFDYVGVSIGNSRQGGNTVDLLAGTNLSIGQFVTQSASAADTAIVAPSGTGSHAIGVVVGSRVAGQDNINVPPTSGQVAIIQIDGIAQCIADGSAIVEGDSVVVSAAVVGGAAVGSAAGTVNANTVALALASTSTAGVQFDCLLETARSF